MTTLDTEPHGVTNLATDVAGFDTDMAQGAFVVYFRVSTARQGASGLGLAAQRETVARYLNGGDWRVVSEHQEVESGRNDARPELDRALAVARAHRCPLLVAKVDRLTRSVAFLSRLLESGVEVRFCDLPQIEGATGRFLLTQMVAVAELEAGLISARTKAALQAAKARGQVLGGFRGRKATEADSKAGVAAVKAKANGRASDLAPIVAEIRSAGVTSARGIAKALTDRGIGTARGSETWTTTQVSRLLARLDA